MLLAFRLGLIVSFLPVALALILLSTPSVGGAPMMVDPECDVSLQTGTTTRTVGEEFDVDIVVSASAEVPVSAIQTFLNFDTSVLEVLDVTHSSGPITPGDVFAEPLGTTGSTGTWTKVLKNFIDNTTSPGQADFAGGRGTESSSVDATAEFVLAKVRFKALAASLGTDITFNASGLRQTKVMSGVDPVTGQLNGVTLFIEEPAEPVDVTFDNMTLQGRTSTDLAWTMPMEVEFYNADTKTLVYEFTPIAQGEIGTSAVSFQVSGIDPGTYDIWVKGENTLAILFEGETISSTPAPISLGVQTGGDAVGEAGGPPDNVVDIDDYDALLAVIFSETSSLTAAEQLNDHTHAGVIDISDYEIVRTNLDAFGDERPVAP